MTSARFRQIRNLFECALEHSLKDHAAFLDQACQGDHELRRELGALLAADQASDAFIDHPSGSSAALAMEGRSVGPYQVIREIGRGGMGAVYLAARTDGTFHKEVAIKVMLPHLGSAEMARHFQQEREILATLENSHITRLLDGGNTEEGLPYYVMEYVDGKRIDHYCDQHRLNITQRLQLFDKVCDGVQYAHGHLVVHGDLKPSNILVTMAGVPKLIDFGTAKLTQVGREGSDSTLTQLWLMTLEYASPEQIRGEPLTPATDVYSLAVVLYELLTGHRPYRMRSRVPHEMAWTICEEEPIRPSIAATQSEENIQPESLSAVREDKLGRLRPRLQGDLDNILLLALRKEPARRYASVVWFREDLERHLNGQPVRARNDAFLYRSRKFVRRKRTEVV